ncbi:hypothetical protein VIGAN_04240100 [Vigna angularis var. angularis]|nr:hypothetical protein VIGAN_04240100 [Vigna angularis var. angularis]
MPLHANSSQHSLDEYGEMILPPSTNVLKSCRVHHFDDTNATFVVDPNARGKSLLQAMPLSASLNKTHVLYGPFDIDDAYQQAQFLILVSSTMQVIEDAAIQNNCDDPTTYVLLEDAYDDEASKKLDNTMGLNNDNHLPSLVKPPNPTTKPCITSS